MPQIKIKRGSSASTPSTMPATLQMGEPAYDGASRSLYVGSSDGAPVADSGVGVEFSKKIGSYDNHSSIGSSTEPIYVNSDGSPTKCDKYSGATKVTVNGDDKGGKDASIYAPIAGGSKSGQIVEYNDVGDTTQFKSDTVGSPKNPLYIKDGVPEPLGLPNGKNYADTDPEFSDISDMVGGGGTGYNGEYYPLYLDAVTTSENITVRGLKRTGKYAGGTRVTLNGSSKEGQDASFYAPTLKIGQRVDSTSRITSSGLFAIEYRKGEGTSQTGPLLSTVVSVADYTSDCTYRGEDTSVITYHGNTGSATNRGRFSLSSGYTLHNVRRIVYYQD